jgi:hypothetical protein
MSWHVLARVGVADKYEPAIAPSQPRIHVSFERSGDPWAVSNNVLSHIAERSGTLPSPTATDLLYLAMTAYAADLRIPRRLAANRWSREIVLHLPVQDLDLWAQHAQHVERTLGFLTGDTWELRCRPRDRKDRPDKESALHKVQAVCLFSGGLDSLVGAIDLLAAGGFVALVGHHGAGVTNSVQERVLSEIKAKYGPTTAPFMFHVQPSKGNVKDGESSMRSRSFLFFSKGVAVNSALNGQIPLVVAENGLISLNVPLTSARTGSRSTRTTHPHYVSLFVELLSRLGLHSAIQMPYQFHTKAEMLLACRDQALLGSTATLTMSCTHPEAGRYRGQSPNHHCGYCVPCIIRKAAMMSAALADAPYNVAVETSPPRYDGATGRDLRAFQMALERVRGMSPNRAAFCVLGPGPLPPDDILGFASVYLRGMQEVRTLLEPTRP